MELTEGSFAHRAADPAGRRRLRRGAGDRITGPPREPQRRRAERAPHPVRRTAGSPSSGPPPPTSTPSTSSSPRALSVGPGRPLSPRPAPRAGRRRRRLSAQSHSPSRKTTPAKTTVRPTWPECSPRSLLRGNAPRARTPSGCSASLVGVPDVAVDDDPGPAVRRGGDREVAADQPAARRASAVDDEHPALAGRLDGLLDQGVVLEHLQRGDRSAEPDVAAEDLEHRLADLDLGVGVAQVGGGWARQRGTSFRIEGSASL